VGTFPAGIGVAFESGTGVAVDVGDGVDVVDVLVDGSVVLNATLVALNAVELEKLPFTPAYSPTWSVRPLYVHCVAEPVYTHTSAPEFVLT
jgi:hypothetical protein